MNAENFVPRTKTSKSQRLRLDRFLYLRETIPEKRTNYFWDSGEDTVDIWNVNYQKQKNYKRHLAEALELKIPKSPEPEKWHVQPWPCVPRKKTHLTSADSILDLPEYSFVSYPDILDWSQRGMLVAALGEMYHLYNWKKQNVIARGNSQFPINCCKFSPQGDLLLLGTDSSSIEFHDDVCVKRLRNAKCGCDRVRGAKCAVTTLDWSPTGNSFVTGCSNGAVSVFSREGSLITSWTDLQGSVIKSTRVSPDARYVAVVNADDPIVYILNWPELKIYWTLNTNWPIKTIVWHPWRSALLGIGVAAPNFRTVIALLEAPSGRLRQTLLGLYNDYGLDAMQFSQRTGEMVLSLWNSGKKEEELTDEQCLTQLVVMSDPYTVVDQSGNRRGNSDGRVQTMVFSPDGTKLATATDEDDLVIWNFLPEDKKKTNKNKPKKFSAMPAFLDQVTFGSTLR